MIYRREFYGAIREIVGHFIISDMEDGGIEDDGVL